MALVGNPMMEERNRILRNYEKNEFHKLAEAVNEVASFGRRTGLDMYTEPNKFFMQRNLLNEMKSLFVDDSYDPKDPMYEKNYEAIKEHNDMMDALFQNDVRAVMEAAPLSAYNPMVGLTFPIHKNLLMTTVFDKGAIPKDVATAPSFTLSMEVRTLTAPDGTEIDMFLEQNKIKSMMESAVPRKEIVMAIPEDFDTDVLGLLGAVHRSTANISRNTKVTKIVVKDVWTLEGEEYMDTDGTIKVLEGAAGLKNKVLTIEPISFVAGYGSYDRLFNKRIDMVLPIDANGGVREEKFQFYGTMHKNRFSFVVTGTENVTHLVLSAALDVSSAAYETPKVKWSASTDYFDIPEAPHITVTLSPEETRDIQAMYNVNQLTKILSMIKLTLVNYKDDKILECLDDSFETMSPNSKITSAFDFVPPDNYLGSFVSWRYETFMDHLDTQVTNLLQVLNDENMTVTIFGRPELIRKISPKEYTYTTPSSIGPVTLDYKKTVKTSDNRIYQFISSNKLRNDNNLIIILCPRNSTRIVYKIFDYQLYVGNEIRDNSNYQLPAVTAFERFLFIQYQPVQGRIQIVNPSGLKEDINNINPVNRDGRAMNDYYANRVTYRDGKWVDNSQYALGTARSAMYPRTKASGEMYTNKTQTVPYAYPNPNYATTDPALKPDKK